MRTLGLDVNQNFKALPGNLLNFKAQKAENFCSPSSARPKSQDRSSCQQDAHSGSELAVPTRRARTGQPFSQEQRLRGSNALKAEVEIRFRSELRMAETTGNSTLIQRIIPIHFVNLEKNLPALGQREKKSP